MKAERNVYGWHVIDPDGGTWWPGDEGKREIDGSDDPGEAALAMCLQEPMRGAWQS